MANAFKAGNDNSDNKKRQKLEKRGISEFLLPRHRKKRLGSTYLK